MHPFLLTPINYINLYSKEAKASFLSFNFQNGIFQNSGKYELGWFLLRLSHIVSYPNKAIYIYPLTYKLTLLLSKFCNSSSWLITIDKPPAQANLSQHILLYWIHVMIINSIVIEIKRPYGGIANSIIYWVENK